MGVKEDVQESFQALGIPDLPPDWVDSLWDCDFCAESVSLPYQAVSEGTLLCEDSWNEAVKSCRKWLRDSGTEEERTGFWTSLMEIGVSAHTILALLYGMMERSKPRPVDRICAVQAARLYLTLLRVPGSGGFKLFHSMIFQKALDAFVLFPTRVESVKRKVEKPKKKQKQKRGRKRKKMVEDDFDEDEEMEFGTREETMTEEGGEEVVAGLLKHFIKELHAFLLKFSLDLHEVSRYQLIQAMLNMTRTELRQNLSLILGDESVAGGRAGGDTPMCILAWGCLDVLCRSLHGSVERLTNELFRQLLSFLLMLADNGGVSTTPLPAHLITCSKHALGFVQYLVRKSRQETSGPLLKLLQHVCTKVPDKAEYRSRVSPLACALLQLLPIQSFSDFMEWLHKFSRNTKIGFRMFALDVFNELLSLSTNPSNELADKIDVRFLLRIVLSRCSDRAPSVRGRALVVLATVASSSSSDLVGMVQASIFLSSTQPATTPGPEGECLVVEMIRRRTSDIKVGVRKAGLQALEAIVRMDTAVTRTSDIQVIHDRCSDPSLAVRKQAIACLTTILLERRENAEVQSLWLDGVLPMVMDKEVGGEEKAVQTLEAVILDNILPCNASFDPGEALAWQLLSLVADDNRVDLQRYLRRAVGEWSRQGKLTRPLVSAVCSHAEHQEHLKAAWMLLSEVSQFTKFVETKFLYDSWKKCSGNKDDCSSSTDLSGAPLVQIMEVVGNQAAHISKIAVDDIKSGIIDLLKGFKMAPPMIKAAVNSVCLICAALTTKSGYQRSVDEWGVPLLKMCEDYISTLIREKRKEEGQNGDARELESLTYLFTLGEVAQLCPAHTSQHLCLMVQSLLLASSETPPTSLAVSVPFSQDVQTESQLSSQQTSVQPSSQASLSLLSGLSKLSMSPTLRAHTYITLGKLCLQNEDLTKRSIVQMVRELRTSKHASIRNNIIIVLCDLAVRYSSRVDPFLPAISSALRDKSLLVRRQTLTLLARLLQEDYIKWKGPLFFHVVSTLVDPEMGGFAEFCLLHLLQVKHPGMFYQHFVECIFFFNSYGKHKVYNRFKVAEGDENLFSMRGRKDAEKRMKIYKFLLSHLTDEHRFQLTSKLCQEVLGGLVDGVMPLNEDSVGVVKDTLAILACKEIKLATLRSNVEEELADEGDQMGAAVAKAQTKIISQLVKRNMIENVVPIVIAAKHLFEREHHPLLKDLLCCLKELMQDYRSEVGEVLAGDPQLAEEITFDLKRFDEEQKKAAAQATPTVATPRSLMASPLLSPGTVVPVHMATLVATPPKMRTPYTAVPAKSVPRHLTARNKTPFRAPLGVTPLVVVQRLPQLSTMKKADASKATTTASNVPCTPFRTPAPRKVGGTPLPLAAAPSSASPPLREEERQMDDVSSPEAARARCQAVRLDYGGIRNPAILGLREKVLSVPLQRSVLFSKGNGRSQAAGRSQRAAEATPTAKPDETLAVGRLASTPEGYAESISFNVSSVLPLSPIAPSNKLGTYQRKSARNKPAREDVAAGGPVDKGKRRSKRLRTMEEEEMAKKQADIILPSPDAKSKENTLEDKTWGVRVQSTRNH